MSIIRYKHSFPFDVFDDLGWFGDADITLPSWSSQKRVWVDPDKYEITPKESYKKILVENKQKEIDRAEESLTRLREELKELNKNS